MNGRHLDHFEFDDIDYGEAARREDRVRRLRREMRDRVLMRAGKLCLGAVFLAREMLPVCLAIMLAKWAGIL